jgi:hypothetical protein
MALCLLALGCASAQPAMQPETSTPPGESIAATGVSVAAMEDSVIAEIQTKGVHSRFVAAGIKPKSDELPCRVTLRPLPAAPAEMQGSIVGFAEDADGYLAGTWVRGPSLGPGFVVDTEQPEDRYCIPTSSSGLGSPHLMGIGSIHRYDGRVTLGGLKFIGEGSRSDRLTFAVLDSGYVYLRGKGRAVEPTGVEHKLGY